MMEKLIKEFTEKLKTKQVIYDSLLAKAMVCLANRIGKCSCSSENRCLNCVQDEKLYDEIKNNEY